MGCSKLEKIGVIPRVPVCTALPEEELTLQEKAIFFFFLG